MREQITSKPRSSVFIRHGDLGDFLGNNLLNQFHKLGPLEVYSSPHFFDPFINGNPFCSTEFFQPSPLIL